MSALRAVWRVADEAGFDHCWVFDHMASGPDVTTGDILEAWTLLGAMAEATSRVRIGCIVTGNTYRHPGVLAKIATTVDHLSAGRLEFGIGAAWAQAEHTMLGLPFGSTGERIDWLAEACQVLKLLWTEPEASFAGSHYQLERAVSNPKPVQRPHPPIWIGAAGERKALRVVARYADVWNVMRPLEDAVRLAGVLDRHCAEIKRDPTEIRRSVQLLFADDVDLLVRTAEQHILHGFTELVVVVRPGMAEREAERVASDVLPRLRQIG